MTTLLDLAARVEALSGPDREVDAEVFRALGRPLPDGFAGVRVDLAWKNDGTATITIGDMQVRYTPPEYTASVDAILALIGRELPGCGFDLSRRGLGSSVRSGACHACIEQSDEDWTYAGWPNVKAATPALALLAATLRAKAAQQQEAKRG